MSEPFTTSTELALERLTRAVTQLTRTVVASDSRHADGNSAILSRLSDVREALVGVLEGLGQTHRAVREVTGAHPTIPATDKEPWYARLAHRFLDAPARSQAAVVVLTAIVALGGWAFFLIRTLQTAGK